MLDGFRESTQFIVVTHNKGTMAASQALYGVTMQVKGVSRFVSVELDEVEEFAPETVGGKPRERGSKPTGEGDAESGDAPGGAPRGAHAPDESGEPIKEIPRAPRGAEVEAQDAGPRDAEPQDAGPQDAEPAAGPATAERGV